MERTINGNREKVCFRKNHKPPPGMAPTTPSNQHYHYALLDMRNHPVKLIKAVIADHQLALAALLLLELHRGADAVGEVVEQLLDVRVGAHHFLDGGGLLFFVV